MQKEVRRRLEAARPGNEDQQRLADNAKRLRADADARRQQARRDDVARGWDNLRQLQLRNAERAADRLKMQERQKWARAGNHPADFDNHWPGIRAELALQMVGGAGGDA